MVVCPVPLFWNVLSAFFFLSEFLILTVWLKYFCFYERSFPWFSELTPHSSPTRCLTKLFFPFDFVVKSLHGGLSWIVNSEGREGTLIHCWLLLMCSVAFYIVLIPWVFELTQLVYSLWFQQRGRRVGVALDESCLNPSAWHSNKAQRVASAQEVAAFSY